MFAKDEDKKCKDDPKPMFHFGVYLVAGFFLMMFSILCTLSLYYNGTLPFSLPEFIDPDESYIVFKRRLTDECYPEAYEPEVNVIWAVLGVMYIFIALAIVCDEFFVPALEVIAEKMKITPDVAGATLMAAGGSAPELFTNFFATFEESDAGFGTIIGSAVFNILFVIGMCAMFSKECLQLTWWPLARDCIFYTMGLILLALFIGTRTRNKIELWEALVLFLMYFLYIFLMYKNQKLKVWFSDKFGVDFGLGTKLTIPTGDTKEHGSVSICEIRTQFTSMIGLNLSKKKTNFRVPGTFRVGIQSLLLSDDKYKSWVSTRAVLDMAGDVKETFDHLDKNGDEKLDINELSDLLKGIDLPVEEGQIVKLMEELDKNKDGKVDFAEFASWYIGSEERLKRDIMNLFNQYDKDRNGKLEKSEVIALLEETNKMKPEEIKEVVKELFKDQDRKGVDKDQFYIWYDASDLFKKQKKESKHHEDVSRGFKQLLYCPQGCFQKIWYFLTLPLMVLFYCTMADIRQVGKSKWCYMTFLMSIIWIGVFAYLMVTWAIAIGDTLKIPNYIMGMTFLAAGTSIPDLLSSVIVARQGLGDMAVSSSIGSNIFDILVGLPIPWIFFILVKGKVIKIISCELALSIIVLIGMLIAVVTAIKASGWKLSKCLGYSMFVLYLVFLTQDLVRNFSGDQCDPICDQ